MVYAGEKIGKTIWSKWWANYIDEDFIETYTGVATRKVA